MSDYDIIKNLYIELSNSSINKDIDKLKDILANDYVLIHMTGKRQLKQDYINSVLSGELKYYETVHESIEVNINRDKATIIGKAKTLASPFGFSKSWWRLRQDVLLEKVNNTWIIKQSKASSY